jgi:nucleoid-associated protein YgaU
MPRMPHGVAVNGGDLEKAHLQLVSTATASPLAFAVVAPADLNAFDFLFPTLQEDPNNLLPESPQTLVNLKNLGRIMEDREVDPEPGVASTRDSNIPAAYTYFAQFVDHDITLEVQPADLPPSASGSMTQILAPDMTPLSVAQIRAALRNFRSPSLDLDSLYGVPAPRDPNNGHKMLIGHVTPLNGTAKPSLRPPGKGDDNDLPREGRGADILHDRAAIIGDPRNDENLIIAQLHLAFLKAHNALVDLGLTFAQARTVLRQHYQHIILHDFLKRVADPQIVDDVIQNGNRWFNASADPFFMPVEFAVAAYRFGHTMARADYNFNLNFNESGDPGTVPATLDLLFTFTALSGGLGFGQGNETLPENWIIQWENFVDTGTGGDFNVTRRLDTKLAGEASLNDSTKATALFNLHNLQGGRESPDDAARLAVRNLLRGYRLRLPTGQAIANFLGLPVLSPAEIEAEADNAEQVQVLQDGGFLDRTPFWYYLLAEAGHGGGNHLGPVGSTIVAEVLVGLVRRSDDSILRQPGWRPSLPSAQPGVFELADLLRFAGVLEGGTAARTYVVQEGDTLSSIAQDQLGDANRWPEIFLLNRNTIRNPDVIFPGQVLLLPEAVPVQPVPRLYVVKPGDTLSGIAQQQLGNASRWPEIFALNSGVISNPDIIFPDQVLVLPS